MPDDFDPKALFGPMETDAAKLDVSRVIRRARRRRLPRQLAVGAGALVTAGVLVAGGVVGLGALSSSGSATSSVAGAPATPQRSAVAPEAGPAEATGSTTSGSSDDTPVKRAPAEKLNLCGGTLSDVAPNSTGLVVTPHFGTALRDAASIHGTVTLTNTSSTRWTGTTATNPAITLSKDGVVLWHTFAASSATRDVDVAPGQSIDYPATFSPVRCDARDDLDGERTDLPHVDAGDYQLSAALDLVGDETSDLVTGSMQTVTLK